MSTLEEQREYLARKWPEFAEVIRTIHDLPRLRASLAKLNQDVPIALLHWAIFTFPAAASLFATEQNVTQKCCEPGFACGQTAVTCAALAGDLDLVQSFSHKGHCRPNMVDVIAQNQFPVIRWWIETHNADQCEQDLKLYLDGPGKTGVGHFLLNNGRTEMLELLLTSLPGLREKFLEPFVLCFSKTPNVIDLLKPTQAQLNNALAMSFNLSNFVSQFVTLVNAGAVMQEIYNVHVNAFIRACCQDVVGFADAGRLQTIFKRGTKRILSADEERWKTKYKTKYKTRYGQMWHDKFFTWPLGPKLRKFVHKGLKPSVAECRQVPRFFLLYASWWVVFECVSCVLPVVPLPNFILDYSGLLNFTAEELVNLFNTK